MKLLLIITQFFLWSGTHSSQRPMDLMADLTNDLGVCILQVQSTVQYGNIAFSPYGLASMSVLLFEGAAGNTALEIMSVMKLPWNTLLVRIGFRDINRHLKTYFKSDGFLKGLIMSRDIVCFHASYQKILRLYGFEEPELALTYPCNTFIPYSPPPTTSPTTNGSTVVSVLNTTIDVVTELTQTSQTVTIRSSPTFTSLKVSKTKLSTLLEAMTTESVAASDITTTSVPISDMPLTSTVISTNAETVTSPPLFNETTEFRGSTDFAIMPTTERAIMKDIQKVADQQYSSTLTPVTNSNTTPSMKFSFFNSNVDSDKDIGSFVDGLSDSAQFGQLFKQNVSLEVNTLFSNYIDKFINNSTFETTTLPDSLKNDRNFWNLKNISIPFSPISDHAANNYAMPLSKNYSEIFDLNNSTFFNTIVNFIENTTQKMKEVIGIGTEPPSIKPVTNSTKNYQTSEIYDTVKEKFPTLPTQIKFNEENLINDSRVNVEGSNDPKVLPKKSISESNENLSAGVTLSSETRNFISKLVPNYKNVLTLRKSRTFSSKLDIRSIEDSRARHRRNILIPESKNNVTSKTTSSHYFAQINAKDDLDNKMVLGRRFNRQIFSVSLRSELEGYLSPTEKVTSHTNFNNFKIDNRNMRSYELKHFQYTTDWFATPDQNYIRVPMFSYSAILPFAYIDELKSKILEIPLDDNNYSLILLLPNEQFGTSQLLPLLSKWPLRRIWDCLKPTAIHASIPKFSIISHIDLKPTLYTLGIRDVFYRYRADLSIMSPDKKLYVRNVEQVVTIYVDKFPNSVYPIPEKLTELQFSISHPFVYFVVDRESGVSLVTGILSNPSKHIIS